MDYELQETVEDAEMRLPFANIFSAVADKMKGSMREICTLLS
jgi:hypothetical protein